MRNARKGAVQGSGNAEEEKQDYSKSRSRCWPAIALNPEMVAVEMNSPGCHLEKESKKIEKTQ